MNETMDNGEIKLEFPIYNEQCSVCLSVGRILLPLGQYSGVYMRIISPLNYPSPCCSLVKLCWECHAVLRKVAIFQNNALKAQKLIQLGQDYIYGTLSALTSVTFRDSNLHTVYINETHKQSEVTCNIDIKYHSDICENDTLEVSGDGSEKSDKEIHKITEKSKQRSNRWALKRASQNKKPKFKIISDYNLEDSFCRVYVNSMESDRDNEYFKSNEWRCNRCIASFENENLLLEHIKRCCGKNIRAYICNICRKMKSDKRKLITHIRAHCYKYQCTLCDYSCCDKTLRKSHFLKQHRKVFECVKCGLKFGSRREFFKHYKKWHEHFICDHCGVSFKMRYCIKDHIRKQHSPYECKRCDKRFARYNGLWLHNKTRHATPAAAYCVECDREYRDVYRYKWHLSNSTRHRPKRTYRIPCPSCDKIFSKKIYMTDHYNLVHLKYYKYRCEDCDKNFIRNADLVKHTKRVHEGILPPKNKICYMCGRGFTVIRTKSSTITCARTRASVRSRVRCAVLGSRRAPRSLRTRVCTETNPQTTVTKNPVYTPIKISRSTYIYYIQISL